MLAGSCEKESSNVRLQLLTVILPNALAILQLMLCKRVCALDTWQLGCFIASRGRLYVY